MEEDISRKWQIPGYLHFYIVTLCVPLREHTRATSGTRAAGWPPHALSQSHKNLRVDICVSLLARHRLARDQHRPFLSCIVTGIFMLI